MVIALRKGVKQRRYRVKQRVKQRVIALKKETDKPINEHLNAPEKGYILAFEFQFKFEIVQETCKILARLPIRKVLRKKTIGINYFNPNSCTKQFIWFSVSFVFQNYSKKVFQSWKTCKILARFWIRTKLFSMNFTFVTCLLNKNLLQRCFLKQ